METRERLKSIGMKGESYDAIINRMLDKETKGRTPLSSCCDSRRNSRKLCRVGETTIKDGDFSLRPFRSYKLNGPKGSIHQWMYGQACSIVPWN